jgi:ribosomal protein S8
MNKITIKFLSQLKNASEQNKNLFYFYNYNKYTINLIKVLYKEGFILSYRIKSNIVIEIGVNFYLNKNLSSLKIISSKSKMVYINNLQLSRFVSKKNFFISTSKGILSLFSCKQKKLGGILIFAC